MFMVLLALLFMEEDQQLRRQVIQNSSEIA